METKNVKMEFECVHNQAAGTMTCSWLGGRVELVCHWGRCVACVLVDGQVRARVALDGMSAREFTRLEEQTAEAAAQLAVFNQEDAA